MTSPRTLIASFLVALPLVGAPLLAGADEAVPEEPAGLSPGTRAISIHSLLELDVQTADDASLGGVHDLVADPTDGLLKFLVVTRGGNLLGMGETRVAIPWHRVTIEEAPRQFRLDMTLDEVELLPDWDGARTESGGLGAAPMSERPDQENEAAGP